MVLGFWEAKVVGPCPNYIPSRFELGVVAPCWDYPADASRKVNVPVWLKAISARDMEHPIVDGLLVKLQVVDSRGVVISGANATITPAVVLTNREGYNAEPIAFRAETLGVYRIRAEYPDYKTTTWSYSPPISVVR